MLRNNTHLFDLNLGNNSVGDTGGYDIFDALTTPLYESEEVMAAKAKVYESGGNIDEISEVYNTTLCVLDVSCNDLGQESAKRLVGVLQVNMVLSVLNLDYNPKLGNTEAREIASAIKTYVRARASEASANKVLPSVRVRVGRAAERREHLEGVLFCGK
jgi:hypothetical protein